MSVNYYFEDFTESNYKNILNLINNNYNTIFFTEYGKPGKNLLLRHDVDISIHRAYRLAQIESEVKCTLYFFPVDALVRHIIYLKKKYATVSIG